MTETRPRRASISIDALGKGNVQLFIRNGNNDYLIIAVPKRQARAIANRILHEIEYTEGKRNRRPSSPFLFFTDLFNWGQEKENEHAA